MLKVPVEPGQPERGARVVRVPTSPRRHPSRRAERERAREFPASIGPAHRRVRRRARVFAPDADARRGDREDDDERKDDARQPPVGVATARRRQRRDRARAHTNTHGRRRTEG